MCECTLDAMVRKRQAAEDAAAIQSVVRAGAALERLLDLATRQAASLSLSQHQVLAALLAADPAPLEPRHIGMAIGSGSAHVTMLLDQLERGGSLERRAHEHDRRRRAVVLTDAGRERARRSTSAVADMARQVMDRAGGADAAAVAALMAPFEDAAAQVEGAVWTVGEGDPGQPIVPGGR